MNGTPSGIDLTSANLALTNPNNINESIIMFNDNNSILLNIKYMRYIDLLTKLGSYHDGQYFRDISFHGIDIRILLRTHR